MCGRNYICKIWNVIDELMDSLHIVNPRLYENIMRKLRNLWYEQTRFPNAHKSEQKPRKALFCSAFLRTKKPVQRREKQAFGFRWCKFQFCKDLGIVFISGDQKCSENILKIIRLLSWLLTGYWHMHILGWNWKVKKHCVCSAFLGGDWGARTPDPLLVRQMLSQLS